MDTEKFFKELDQVEEWVCMFIQLRDKCFDLGGNRLHSNQIPSFEYFKDVYIDPSYSLSIPSYKDSILKYPNGTIAEAHTHGLGTPNGIKTRYYNYWMGCKFYTNKNIKGKYHENTTP